MSNNKQQVDQLLRLNKVLHEAIIDLYLQVKIRSNEEIDHFNEGQFNKERDRLLKFDSLTVLDYIRTSIEILMQMKLEEEKLSGEGVKKQPQRLQREESNQSSIDQHQQTPLSSTTKSIDLPPKEYEQQLQQYESEVRNHIKVEQQLKLHIEVLQDKLDDIEKDREATKKEIEREKKELQEDLQKRVESAIQQKDKEIDKLAADIKQLSSQLNAQTQQILDKQKTQQINTTAQQQNLIQSIKQNMIVSNSTSNQGQRVNTSQSKSPPSHSNVQYSSTGKKIKTLSQGKSPYLNDCFFKLVNGGTQLSTGAVSNGQASSNNSSAKSHRKGSQSVIQDMSVIEGQQPVAAVKKQKQKMANQIAGNSIAENMKLIAAIQRMRSGNQGGLQSNTAVQQNSSGLSQQQIHKKNKSFSHYGTSNGNIGNRVTTQNSAGQQQHYLTTNEGSGGNNWMINESQNFGNSFSNDPIQIRETSQQDQQNQNNKILMMGVKQQNAGRIQVIENLTNNNNQKNTQSIHQPQFYQNFIMQSNIDSKGQNVDNEAAYQRKKVKKQKAKRDGSSQSGRGGSQSQNHTQQNFNLNPTYSNNHHRVYSIDMIESLQTDGNMIAANHQDIMMHKQAIPKPQVDSQKIKKITQQQISQQRGRPKSQMGNYIPNNI